uniref:Uncharacterized protein n=1 Tax=Poecilia mexicana TaxID=48701 RepID=A0A3B3Y788_9TELE
PIILNRKKKFGGQRSTDFNCDFEFGERDGLSLDDDWAMSDVLKQLKKKRTLTTLDQKIEKVRKKRKAEEKSSQSSEAEGSEMKEEEEEEPADRNEEDEDGDEEEEFGSSDEEVLTKSGMTAVLLKVLVLTGSELIIFSSGWSFIFLICFLFPVRHSEGERAAREEEEECGRGGEEEEHRPVLMKVLPW